MLFNSFDFLFFFLVVFALFIIGGRWRWLIMLVASYFFGYIGVFAATAIANVLVGILGVVWNRITLRREQRLVA